MQEKLLSHLWAERQQGLSSGRWAQVQLGMLADRSKALVPQLPNHSFQSPGEPLGTGHGALQGHEAWDTHCEGRDQAARHGEESPGSGSEPCGECGY